MALSTKDFRTLVSEQTASIQSKVAALIDFTIGSTLRAIVEANAAMGLWIQSLIIRLLATTRAATSTAEDLDSWLNDYGVTRLPAQKAIGFVTFARFTPTLQAIIPVGSLVQSSDGVQKFVVKPDLGNPLYSSSANGYVLPPGVFDVTVPVEAVTPGSAGNMAIEQCNSITQAITYVDTVTNKESFVGGKDSEADSELRARFVAYIASLSRATIPAISFAIASLRVGTNFVIVENEAYTGEEDTGYFYIVVDDGTGSPSDEFISSVYNAVDSVRPVATRFGVFAPEIVFATVGLTVDLAPGFDSIVTRAEVDRAVTDYINKLKFGEELRYTRIPQVAYEASPGVVNVREIIINESTNDLAATNRQVIKASSVTVN